MCAKYLCKKYNYKHSIYVEFLVKWYVKALNEYLLSVTLLKVIAIK